MGKGDKKSKKGKRFKASFGNSRPRMAIVNRTKKSTAAKPAAVTAAAEEKPKPVKKAPRKKADAAE